MKKRIRVASGLFLVLLLLSGAIIIHAAEPEYRIGEGEKIDTDFIKISTFLENKGSIRGDLITFSRVLISQGAVEGDIIAAANTAEIAGQVGGSIRAGGVNVSLASTVERNVMIFGTNVKLEEKAHVKKNVYLAGDLITVQGTVDGNTHIYGQNITLAGNFKGDVYINDMHENSSLNILEGTNISGKLVYRGEEKYQVPSNVNVAEYEFIEIQPQVSSESSVGKTVYSYIRKIFTLALYYLFALLLYKLFPRYFEKAGNFIAQKPASAAGIGIAAFGSMIGGIIFLLILLLVTLFIFKGSVFMFAGLLFLFAAIVTFLFAEIPVSLWLGSRLIKDKKSIPAKLALGLVIIWALKIILQILKGVSGVSGLVGIVSFIFNAAVWILGTGAILKSVSEIVKGANMHAETELEAIEELE